jgi:hypothetical protein
MPAVMPRERKFKEPILILRPPSDVMDNPRSSTAIWRWDNKCNVRQLPGHRASDQITREIVGGIFSDWQ